MVLHISYDNRLLPTTPIGRQDGHGYQSRNLQSQDDNNLLLVIYGGWLWINNSPWHTLFLLQQCSGCSSFPRALIGGFPVPIRCFPVATTMQRDLARIKYLRYKSGASERAAVATSKSPGSCTDVNNKRGQCMTTISGTAYSWVLSL